MSQLINFDAFCVRHLHVDKYKFLSFFWHCLEIKFKTIDSSTQICQDQFIISMNHLRK